MHSVIQGITLAAQVAVYDTRTASVTCFGITVVALVTVADGGTTAAEVAAAAAVAIAIAITSDVDAAVASDVAGLCITSNAQT